MTIPPNTQAKLAVDSRCRLGEGVLWCARREAILWTDIPASRLWMHRPSDGLTGHWPLPQRLGCFALCASGRLLLGLAKGLFHAEVESPAEEMALEPLVEIETEEPRTRANDGRCDRSGNFVFGTLNEDPAREPIGSLYQYSLAAGLRRLDLPGVAIPNSICFSPDGATLYYCDSMQPRILCCDYEAETAHVANARLFAALPEGGSCPDGSTIDGEGFLWNAQWGGGRVVRYSPRGRVDLEVRLPTPQPTCVAFGGARLNALYITTARDGLGEEQLSESPGSGGVFEAASPVRGLPESLFADQ